MKNKLILNVEDVKIISTLQDRMNQPSLVNFEPDQPKKQDRKKK
jgi:hypothetical protein